MPNLPVIDKAHSSYVQLTRYTILGILINLAGYLVYLLATHLGAAPKLTMTLLYAVAALISYIGNRNLTFLHQGNLLGSGVRYIIAHSIGYSINLTILIIFVDKLGYAHQWVQAFAIFVVANYFFIALKFFVFTDLKESNADSL